MNVMAMLQNGTPATAHLPSTRIFLTPELPDGLFCYRLAWPPCAAALSFQPASCTPPLRNTIGLPSGGLTHRAPAPLHAHCGMLASHQLFRAGL